MRGIVTVQQATISNLPADTTPAVEQSFFLPTDTRSGSSFLVEQLGCVHSLVGQL
jgi:hypothetical protein